VIQFLQQISFERAALLVFLAGQVYGRFKDARRSLRAQGQRIGDVETRLARIEGKLGVETAPASPTSERAA